MSYDETHLVCDADGCGATDDIGVAIAPGSTWWSLVPGDIASDRRSEHTRHACNGTHIADVADRLRHTAP